MGTIVKLTARRSKIDLRNVVKNGVAPHLPVAAQKALKEILGGLREFCNNDQALIEELVSGEDETKKTRAALKGKEGGEIKFALGYIYALADVYDCEPVELVR